MYRMVEIVNLANFGNLETGDFNVLTARGS